MPSGNINLAHLKAHADKDRDVALFPHEATSIIYDNTSSGLASDNVQDAVDEINDRTTNLETDYAIKELWEDISNNTTGTITVYQKQPPYEEEIIEIGEDKAYNGEDALCVQIGEDGRPKDEAVLDANGKVVLADIDSSGNYTLHIGYDTNDTPIPPTTPISGNYALIWQVKGYAKDLFIIPASKLVDSYNVDSPFARDFSTKEIFPINDGDDLNIKSGGFKDENVTTAVKLGDSENASLDTDNKTILGGINEVYNNPLSCGIIDIAPPTLTDNGNGTCTIASCNVAIMNNANHIPPIKKYTVAEATLSFTDGAEEYVAVDYNSGSPIYYKETNPLNLNGSDKLFIYAVWRVGNILHSSDQDSIGLGLSNKINERMLLVEPYAVARTGGLALSETTTPANRTILCSSALVFKGVAKENVLDFDSSADSLTEVISTASGWTYNNVTVYDNQNYNPVGSGKLPMLAEKWGFRLFYRSIGDAKQVFYVLNTDYYVSEALAREQATKGRSDIPTVLKNHCLWVGYSLIQYNATSGTTESLTLTKTYSSGFVLPNHDDTLNKSLAGSGVTWGHISSDVQTIYGAKTFDSNIAVSTSLPTLSSHLTRKDYVDSGLSGKADIISGGVEDNFVSIDSVGNIKDSGFNAGDFALYDAVVDLVSNQTIGGIKTFSDTVYFNGSAYFAGEKVQVDTKISVSDNILALNFGEVGAGVTNIISGTIVDRGSLDPFAFVLNESTGYFGIGIYKWEIDYNGKTGSFNLNDEVKGLTSLATGYVVSDDGSTITLKITNGTFINGETLENQTVTGSATITTATLIDDTQTVLTRQDTPTSNGILYYNATEMRGDTSSNFTYNDTSKVLTINGKTSTEWNTAYTHSQLTSGNPHNVTKSDIGLGNVENTALSTWAGSSNITTLGTISSGVWNGSIIGASYIEDKFLRNDGSDTTSGSITCNNIYTNQGNGLYITDNDIYRKSDTSNLVITGGDPSSANGANIELYGGLHPTLANLGVFDCDEHRFRNVASNKTILTMKAVDGTAVFNAVVSWTGGNSTNANTAYSHSQLTSGNPHNVTKSNVGLGNVENTALSTWTGSSNITTLGTISSGVWNGSTIGASYIEDKFLRNDSNDSTTGTLTINGSLVLASGSITDATKPISFGSNLLLTTGGLIADAYISTQDYYYIGDQSVDGSIRLINNSGELAIEKRVSGSWVDSPISEVDTLDSVTTRGNTTTNPISVKSCTINSDDATESPRINYSSSNELRYLSEQSTSDNSYSTTTGGGFIFVGTSTGVEVYESDNAGSITYKNQVIVSDYVLGMVYLDGILYCACNTLGVKSYSVNSTTGALTLIDTDYQGGNYYDVTSDGMYIYCAIGLNGVVVYSVSSGVFTLTNAKDAGGSYNGVYYDSVSGYLICANDSLGIMSYSISAGTITLVDSDFVDGSYQKVTRIGSYLAVTCYGSGVRIYTINSGVFSLVDTDTQGGNYTYVATDGIRLFCNSSTKGLLVYNVETSTLYLLDEVNTSTSYQGISSDGYRIYAMILSDGFKVYEIKHYANVDRYISATGYKGTPHNNIVTGMIIDASADDYFVLPTESYTNACRKMPIAYDFVIEKASYTQDRDISSLTLVVDMFLNEESGTPIGTFTFIISEAGGISYSNLSTPVVVPKESYICCRVVSSSNTGADGSIHIHGRSNE